MATMTPPTTLRIAAIQMCSRQDRDENLDRARALLDEAVRQGAQLVTLPENFSFLDREGDKLQIIEDLDTGPSVRMLQEFAAAQGVAVVGGSVPLQAADTSKVTNTCLVFDPAGQIVARYDKVHLFDISLDAEHTFKESRYIEAGAQGVTVDLFGHTMGLSICYDLRFPELYRRLVLRGAKVLFIPSAFTMHTGKDHWEVLIRARAIENQCYVVAPAQYGRHNDRRVSYGRTMIVDPWGQVLAQAQDRESVVVADIDLAYLDDIRRRLPCLEHIRLMREDVRTEKS